MTVTDACQAGRLRLCWQIEPVTSKITSSWPINAAGQPRLDLDWGGRRRRQVATLWIRPGHGPKDDRPARVAFKTGPLEALGVTWEVAWHTWDRQGVGGENASDGDLASALESVLVALLRQGLIPGLRASEVGQLFSSAAILAGEWIAARGLSGVRWSGGG